MNFIILNPKFPLPEGDPYDYLRDNCFKGLVNYDVFQVKRVEFNKIYSEVKKLSKE